MNVLSSPSGIRAEFTANGSIRRIDHGDIMVNLFLGNEADGGLANIHLRRLDGPVESIPMIGPVSPAAYAWDERGMFATGRWGTLDFRLRFVLAESAAAWFWHIELHNTGDAGVNCDLIHTQDIGLAHYGAIRLNEYYVSQYIDHCPLVHPANGHAVASRQNQSMGGRCPWSVIGSLNHARSFATDALQFHGLASRAGRPAGALATGLPGTRLQHEHSLVAIQDDQITLAPGARVTRGFFAWLEADKPTATSTADQEKIAAALALPEARPPVWPAGEAAPAPAASLFATAPGLETIDLDDATLDGLFGRDRHHEERDTHGVLSYFTGAGTHVVLKAKELQVLRPHGHLLRSGGALVPDESSLTSTAWMNGVFHSMVTQGHVSINRFLSTCHTYLGLFRSHGQRVFAEIGGTWQLLDQPSAFAMSAGSCRWIYKYAGGMIEVLSSAPDDTQELRLTVNVLDGPPARFLITHHVAINGDDGSPAIPVRWEADGSSVFVRAIPDCDVGWRFPDGGFRITPAAGTALESIGGDEWIFADTISRDQPFLCLITAPARSAGLIIHGHLVESTMPQAGGFWHALTTALHIEAPASSTLADAAGRTGAIFPWFIHNALVHYLSPRGLEQYSGGGWGTRDVCQGPVELLLALGHHDPIRDLLCRVFRQQNPDGDWPQWFMFFERERNIRPGDSHGDIVYWPVLALAQYLTATGDASLLDEPVPFFHPDGDSSAESCSVWQHVDRALGLIQHRVIAGTHLAAYGHGDWNDSLQPAKPDMREHLCSAWTVTLNYQTIVALAAALRQLGHTNRAADLDAKAAVILAEFQHILIVDDVIAGLAYFHEDGKTDHLLHPRDTTTGLSYSVLPMIHAIINDMLTPDQAAHHLGLIRDHLTGPDGAHLFDRPMAYHGGPQKYFQRAESASFFGREIGIMYTHAHLRYCEALARFGDAGKFFHALCQINPIGIRGVVPSATLRQANCYYSSSDPAFADRYQAFADYAKVNTGEIALEGGWRVYSSGAGIATRLIMQCFLGLRQEHEVLLVDPVIPAALSGMTATVHVAGHPLTVTYHVNEPGHGTLAIIINGTALAFTRVPNPYRPGPARLKLADLTTHLTGKEDQLEITVG